MKMFIASTLPLLLLFHLAQGQSDLERSKMERKFKELHPKINKVTWKEIENLKPETLKRVCDQVVKDVADPKRGDHADDFKYIAVDESKLAKERIIPKAVVEFVYGMQYTIQMPVIMCLYEGTEFYLCHGDDKHVFRLFRDTHNTFTFRSGMHEVEWK